MRKDIKKLSRIIFPIMFAVVSVFYLPAQAVDVWVENFPPFGYEENNKLTGLSTEVLEYIMKDTGIKAEKWEIAPWARAYMKAQKNHNSILCTVVKTSEREKMFHWIGPIADRNIYVYKLKSRKDIQINSLEDLKKYSVGVVRKVAAADLCKEKGITVEETNSDELNLKKLHAKRIDLAIFFDYAVSYFAKLNSIPPAVFSQAYLFDGSQKYYIVIQKDSDAEMVKKLQNSFNKLKNNGGLQKIQQKFLK
jgi:polar amino acid transport system substrate-binding protein